MQLGKLPVLNAGLAAFTTCLFLGACVGTTRIEVKDRDVVVPSLRIVWQKSELWEPVDEPSSARRGLRVELDLSAGRGRSSQDLAAGQAPIKFNGASFVGPQTIDQRFDFFFVGLAAGTSFFPGDGAVGFEALVGGGYSALDLRLDSGSQRVKDELSSVGVTVALGILWRARPRTTVQGRWTAFTALDEPSGVTAVELVATQAVGRHVKLRGGYAQWEVEANSGSDIEIEFSGPLLGFELDFRSSKRGHSTF